MSLVYNKTVVSINLHLYGLKTNEPSTNTHLLLVILYPSNHPLKSSFYSTSSFKLFCAIDPC